MLNYNFRSKAETFTIDFENFRLKIENVSQDVATVYFIDAKGDRIAPPNRYKMFNSTSREYVSTRHDMFYITCFCDYEMFYYDPDRVLVFQIHAKKESGFCSDFKFTIKTTYKFDE